MALSEMSKCGRADSGLRLPDSAPPQPESHLLPTDPHCFLHCHMKAGGQGHRKAQSEPW